MVGIDRANSRRWQSVRQRAGRWQLPPRLWEVRSEHVLALGLPARSIDAHGQQGL